MKKFWVLALFLAVTAATMFTFVPSRTSAQANKLRSSKDAIPGSYIVVLNESVVGNDLTEGAVEGEANYLTGSYGGGVKAMYSSALKGFSAVMSEDQAAAMSADDRVAYIEQDRAMSVSSTQTGAGWNLDRVDQRPLPLNSTFDYSSAGAGAHIYVLDTGIRISHSDFGGRASVALDVLNDGQNGLDCNGHGTHVAATAAGATYGVAKAARVYSVRVLPCGGGGQISDLITAIDWLTSHRSNPAVANISITAPGDSPPLETAITNSIASGITYTIAAGNAGWYACDYTPARTPNAITVGATSQDDFRPNYSNYGACVDIFAPGYQILSAGIADDFASRLLSGTSQAAPLVAGVAAVYRAGNPSASPSTVTQAILGASTPGLVTNEGDGSPNRLLYSWVTGGPVPTPTATPTPTPTPSPAPSSGKITVRKRAIRQTSGPASTAAFPYQATNISTPSFSLVDSQEFIDPSVPGSAQTIAVTESTIAGWRLTAIECVEIAGATPNVINTTVDLANRRANIIVENGEQVTCTFTSQELAPTAALAEVSGRVTDESGRGIRNMKIMLQDAATGRISYASTTSFGLYRFTDLELNHFYIVTALETKKYPIPNNTRSFVLNDNLGGVDFITEQSGIR